MDDKSKIVINNIKSFLKINNKNQSDLASFLNVPRQTISRILNNQRDINIQELKRISEYLNVSVDTLYKDKSIRLEKKQTLYHGSYEMNFIPKFGLGDNRHDYGKGFYLSVDKELAKEWAVCNSEDNGYLHKYELDTSNLSILYLNEEYGVLSWLAVLACHREADTSKRYRINAEKLIKNYLPKNINKYDVIVGYRADDSYFSFAKNAIKNNIDISLLERIMKAGNLGYQVFIQTEKAFNSLKEICNDKGYFEEVNIDEYFIKYEERDHQAREEVSLMIDSDENTLEDTIEKYLK